MILQPRGFNPFDEVYAGLQSDGTFLSANAVSRRHWITLLFWVAVTIAGIFAFAVLYVTCRICRQRWQWGAYRRGTRRREKAEEKAAKKREKQQQKAAARAAKEASKAVITELPPAYVRDIVTGR